MRDVAPGNVVLLGDAAHTAHFTIGSGTKLAMEDAISLAGALERHPADLERALTSYELERQPAVERTQRAALDSAAYFENVSRYASFEPVRFAVNLLTRSGRISYANLTQRDPALVERSDAAFAVGSRWRRGAARTTAHLRPVRRRWLRLANRVVVSPPSQDDAEDGTPSAALGERLAQAAVSGVGLIVSEFVSVSADGRITSGTPGLYEDAHTIAWRGIADRVHEARAAFGVRLGHAGPRGATRSRRLGIDLPLLHRWPLLLPNEMTQADMDRAREDFGRAVSAAIEAGADLLEVDAAHGYLLGSFLSPLSNARTDAFGGSLDARMRFPLEVIGVVRGAWSGPMSILVPATDWARGASDIADAVAFARAVRDLGADLIHVASGYAPRANPDYGPGYLVTYADRIRNEAGVNVIVEGRLWTLDQANTILAAGRADLVVLDT